MKMLGLTCGSKNGNSEILIKEAQKKSVLKLEGKRIHFYEIREVTQGHMPKIEEIKRLADQYKRYKPFIKPPSKQKSAST
jgi:hypothetical protein